MSRFRHADAVDAAAYDEDTLGMYNQSFAREVRIVTRDLLIVGGVGKNEARALSRPQSAHDIESIGLRLVELGTLRSWASRSAA